jgi:hypothetical protein
MNESLVAERASCDVLRAPGRRLEPTAAWKPAWRTRVCQPIVSCLAALPARQLRCLAEHPVGYLAEIGAELRVVGLWQGT